MKKSTTSAHTPNTIKKLIEIPLETAAGLTLLASRNNLQTKPYLEKVLIEHEQRNNKRDKNNRLK